MRIINDFEMFDVYEMKEPAKIDNGLYTMYLAPNQHWDKKSELELEKDNVYIGETVAVMVRENSFVITGHSGEGCVAFVKNKTNISPTYMDEFPMNAVYNSAKDLLGVLAKSGLI